MKPDLNLLVVFDAVASAGSVTRAAERLSLSQPAISHALNRLRAHFGDPLFFRKGAGVQLTPRALNMKAEIRFILQSAETVLANQPFNPANNSRKFRIAASDYALATLVPQMQKRFREHAPYCQLEIVPVEGGVLTQMERGTLDCSYWGTTTPEGPWVSQILFQEHYVGVVSKVHPVFENNSPPKITLDDYLKYPHIVVSMKDPGRNQIDFALEKLGKQRRIAMATHSFIGNMECLTAGNLIASLPAKLVQTVQPSGLIVFELPFDVPAYDYSLIWHNQAEKDEGLLWFRTQIIDSVTKTD